MFSAFFYLLRARGLDVSLNEWLTLMEALEKGLAQSSLTSFYYLARAILVKSETEFDKLKTSKKDIAYLKKKRNKFSAWWHNLWKNLIKKIFAFYYFEDISAISFNTSCFNLLSSLTNLSYVTRIDRFVGFEMEEIDTENKAPKREYDKFYASAKVVGSGLFLIFCILISIIISSSFQPLFLMILISILLCLIGAVSLFVSVLNLARTIAVGTLRHGRAEEILN